MSRTEELKGLFLTWAELHVNESDTEYYQYHNKQKTMIDYIPKQNFFSDGIIFENAYEKAENKILFIAKEQYSYPNNAGAANEIRIQTDENFWAKREIEKEINGEKSNNRFLKGVAMLYNAVVDNDYLNPHKDVKCLSNVAFMNLNKRGGYKNCIWSTLVGYVEKYRNMIEEQIMIINPDIIICCGNSVWNIVKKYNLAENKKVICARHPAYRISDINKLDFLKKSIDEQATK